MQSSNSTIILPSATPPSLLDMPEEVLFKILLLVEPSQQSISILPRVCCRFHHTFKSIPISIRCDLTIFTPEHEMLDSDEDSMNFKIVSKSIGGGEYELKDETFAKRRLMKGRSFYLENVEDTGEWAWRVAGLSIYFKNRFIPGKPDNLVAFLKDFVESHTIGDNHGFKNVTVLFENVDFEGYFNVSNKPDVLRLCRFAKAIRPEKLIISANPVLISELKDFPAWKLELTQCPVNCVANLPIQKFASSLLYLRLKPAPFDFGAPRSNQLHSLDGIEALVNLKSVNEFWVGDAITSEAFFHVLGMISSPQALDVCLDLIAEPDFLDTCLEKLESQSPTSKSTDSTKSLLRFNEIKNMRLVNFPITMSKFESTIDKIIDAFPNLDYLAVTIENPNSDKPLEILEEMPLDKWVNLSELLDMESKLTKLDIFFTRSSRNLLIKGRSLDVNAEDIFEDEFENPLASMCEDLRLLINARLS
ncbi:hypothetical protein HDU76_002627 [Blyttiomyces sp. JEL0837]|nr:hypothetical protein HDU76_002627 [Blyttiomyces sp. JEL0837]